MNRQYFNVLSPLMHQYVFMATFKDKFRNSPVTILFYFSCLIFAKHYVRSPPLTTYSVYSLYVHIVFMNQCVHILHILIRETCWRRLEVKCVIYTMEADAENSLLRVEIKQGCLGGAMWWGDLM